MDTLLKDIRYSLRGLLKQPAFTAVAVLTLALGIGANTAIFSVINALILNPPAFANPEQVVAIWETTVGTRGEGFISYPNLVDWQNRNQSFTSIAGYKPNGFNLTENGEAERVQGMRVTANFFPLLKTNLWRGRNFQPDEDKKGAPPVTIISYEFWQTRLGGSESVLSQPLSINGKSFSIIGVLPPRFEFPLVAKDTAIWTTVAGEGGNLDERGAHVLLALGRLKSGVSLAAGQTEIATIASTLASEYPKSNTNTTAFLVPAHEQVVGRDVRRALWLLFGAVVFILLIACTNTANLLLVRASARQKETAIRAALGAGRGRIARQLLTESIILSLVAGTTGLLIAFWGIRALTYFGADQLPRLEEVRINFRILTFTFVVSVATGLLFSLLPTFKASQMDVNEVLKSGTKAATSGRSMRVWRSSLVVLEIALSLILLVGAGLMIKSFGQLVNVPPGFDPHNVLTGRVGMARAAYENPEERVRYVDRTLNSLLAIPGVESAAFVSPMPFSGGNVGGDFRFEGQPEPEAGHEPNANVRSVTAQYFEAIKIPLLKGRYFSEHDRRGGVGAAIVNQTFVQRYFPNEEPLGKRLIKLGVNQNDGDPQTWEIVGVVGDVHHSNLIKAATPELYLPFQQNSWSWGNFFVRTTVPTGTIADSFRERIRNSDRAVPLTDVRPLTQAISDTVTQSRFYTLLFGLFGAIGLLLTLSGVYALISYTVAQRTQEIGIRMALGATQQSVVRLVLRQGLVLSLLGAAGGLAVSFALTRLIVGLLFQVTPTDLSTFIVATAVLLISAVLATYLPARRATRVDPLVALRYE
ncbi:MAG TPA: ABC transporter permease [Pyrinomonadaceae bacterium]|nr:ABC transporter permease [Pyrinomonadaceae bacterium]